MPFDLGLSIQHQYKFKLKYEDHKKALNFGGFLRRWLGYQRLVWKS